MNSNTSTRTVTLEVKGMTCGSCRRHVNDALAAVPNVEAVDVDLGAGTAVVSSSNELDGSALVEAVREAGYQAALVVHR